MNIVLLGAPASGKGTQAELLASKFNLYHFQTGAIARELAKTNSRIAEIVNSGKLIPQEEMTMYAIDYLRKNHGEMHDILFEGFPRFISQYQALKDFLKSKGDDLDVVISLEVSESVAIKRMSARRTCENCGSVFNMDTNPPKAEGICDKCGGKLVQRQDDQPEAIKTRFQYYHDNTKELLDFLEKEGNLKKVNGERSIEEIQNDLTKIVEELK